MSRLFIALHLDEDVTVVLADVLRARDFDVTTTQEKGLREAEDHEQLAHAVKEGRCILTHNRVHFQNLAKAYFEEGRHHHGIIIATQQPLKDLIHGVLAILNNVTADEMLDQIRYV